MDSVEDTVTLHVPKSPTLLKEDRHNTVAQEKSFVKRHLDSGEEKDQSNETIYHNSTKAKLALLRDALVSDNTVLSAHRVGEQQPSRANSRGVSQSRIKQLFNNASIRTEAAESANYSKIQLQSLAHPSQESQFIRRFYNRSARIPSKVVSHSGTQFINSLNNTKDYEPESQLPNQHTRQHSNSPLISSPYQNRSASVRKRNVKTQTFPEPEARSSRIMLQNALKNSSKSNFLVDSRFEGEQQDRMNRSPYPEGSMHSLMKLPTANDDQSSSSLKIFELPEKFGTEHQNERVNKQAADRSGSSLVDTLSFVPKLVYFDNPGDGLHRLPRKKQSYLPVTAKEEHEELLNMYKPDRKPQKALHKIAEAKMTATVNEISGMYARATLVGTPQKASPYTPPIVTKNSPGLHRLDFT